MLPVGVVVLQPNSEARSGPMCLYTLFISTQPFNTHCCRMVTAIKHPVPDRVKPSFVIFDIRAL